jgi:hypothetical protein
VNKQFLSALQIEQSAEIAKRGWHPRKTASGVIAHRVPSPEVENEIHFTVIGKRSEGIYFQPGLGVRIGDVNRIKNRLTPENHNRNGLTAYTLVSRLSDSGENSAERWFVPSSEIIVAKKRMIRMVAEVFEIVQSSEFFERINSTEKFLLAVERRELPFYGDVSEHYIAALICVGQLDLAKAKSAELREQVEVELALRGTAPDATELAFYDRVAKGNW